MAADSGECQRYQLLAAEGATSHERSGPVLNPLQPNLESEALSACLQRFHRRSNSDASGLAGISQVPRTGGAARDARAPLFAFKARAISFVNLFWIERNTP
jgi:hypothetical protein